MIPGKSTLSVSCVGTKVSQASVGDHIRYPGAMLVFLLLRGAIKCQVLPVCHTTLAFHNVVLIVVLCVRSGLLESMLPTLL